jgi:hypothetical protein
LKALCDLQASQSTVRAIALRVPNSCEDLVPNTVKLNRGNQQCRLDMLTKVHYVTKRQNLALDVWLMSDAFQLSIRDGGHEISSCAVHGAADVGRGNLGEPLAARPLAYVPRNLDPHPQDLRGPGRFAGV